MTYITARLRKMGTVRRRLGGVAQEDGAQPPLNIAANEHEQQLEEDGNQNRPHELRGQGAQPDMPHVLVEAAH
jgi:hypothetical protein